MTLQQLRYIVALDQYRHFATAARECMVTQPTLTMQVKKLETEMGVLLFDRSKHPLEPTATGSLILSKAREILQQSESLFQFVRGVHTEIEGDFTIGVIPTIAPYLLPRFLPKMSANAPSTHLNIVEMQTERIIESLQEGSIDIGILVTPLDEPSIREIPLFEEPFLIFSKEEIDQGERTPKDLPKSGLLLLEEGHCFRSQALEICNRDAKSPMTSFSYESGSIESLKALVREGIGYTLVPALSAKGEDEGYLHRFKSPVPVREVSLAVHNSFARERLLEVLRETVLQSVPEDMRSEENYYKVRWRQL